MVTIKTAEDIILLREGGARLGKILSLLSKKIAPGLRTSKLEAEARRLIAEGGDTPSFLNYQPEGAKRSYPAALCVSINDEVVHGLPGERVIQSGDVVGLDLGLIHRKVFLDSALTVGVAPLSKLHTRLIKATREALKAGIRAVRAGVRTGDIGAAIAAVASREGFTVVRDLSGHGVGYAVHEDPVVPNWGKEGEGEPLYAGTVLAIEPMFTTGDQGVRIAEDGFTFVTKKGSVSAHFEHTVVVTEAGAEILTAFAKS